VSWLALVAGIAAMRAAMEHGDVDDAARLGAAAGEPALRAALASPDRATVLGAIAAAPVADDAIELLPALAHVAAGPDRRLAIPAAAAARSIATRVAGLAPDDDVAPADRAAFAEPYGALALRGDRWIEVRVLALDTAAALDPLGAPLATALASPDPALRLAAIEASPSPLAAPLAAALDAATHDPDAAVAAAATLALCIDRGTGRCLR
jgi:hypothetical protein